MQLKKFIELLENRLNEDLNRHEIGLIGKIAFDLKDCLSNPELFKYRQRKSPAKIKRHILIRISKLNLICDEFITGIFLF